MKQLMAEKCEVARLNNSQIELGWLYEECPALKRRAKYYEHNYLTKCKQIAEQEIKMHRLRGQVRVDKQRLVEIVALAVGSQGSEQVEHLAGGPTAGNSG